MKNETNYKNPMRDIDDWEDNLKAPYPNLNTPAKKKEAFGNYVDSARVDLAREFYRINHTR